ncbi:MAG: helix-turn-helix domain-containing protein [Clostridia bacterium]|nr:helix-turn-helix domain-containing protein [Clostridia bacterium]
MKTAKTKQLFSASYIHIYFSSQTGERAWWKNEKGEDFWSGEHTFDCDALYFVTEGEFELTIKGEHYRVRPGQMSYIPAGTPHERRITIPGPVRKYYTHFDLLFGTKPLNAHFNIPVITNITDTDQAIAFFQILKECYYNPDTPQSVIRANGILLQLIALVLTESGATLNPDEKDTEHSMQAAIQYIHANLHRTVTVAELAEITGYSPGHFAKTFRQCFGLLPLDYITKIKINQAQKRLRETRLSVSVIAEELGYCDANYFGKVFKKKTGVSPLQYRKTARHRV